MFKTKVKLKYLVVIITAFIVLMTSAIVSIFVSPNEVLALTSTSSAIQVGNGTELYDSSNQSFNQESFEDLMYRLFNGQEPLSYVKSMKDSGTDSYVVPASTINGGNDNGYIVKLGGLDWMITSLTVTDSTTYKKEDIVVTLYLADSIGTTRYWSSASDDKGTNMYSRSILRHTLLNDTRLKQFVSGSFAEQFLVQPTHIKYQHIETVHGRTTVADSNYNFSNDALDDLDTNWSSLMSAVHYRQSDKFTDPSGNLVSYSAWGNDYIWIPSIAESGSSSFVTNTSIWKLSNNQLMHNCNDGVWYRTGGVNTFNWLVYLQSSSSQSTKIANDVSGIRPAIHLNLSEIIRETSGLDNPQDMTTTYNEEEQTIKSIATETKASWYNKDIYEHVDNYINIAYPENAKWIMNAKEYWVEISIIVSWIKNIFAEVDKEGSEKGWTAEKIKTVKLVRTPHFLDTPNTQDSAHLETETVRWIKVTINKAEIDFKNVVWSANSLEYNALNQTVTILSGLPSFLTVTYSGNINKNVNTDGTFYTAKVIGITSTDSNYNIPTTTAELDKIPQLQHKWTITKKKLNASWTTEEKTSGGITLKLPALSLAESLTNVVEYKYYKDSNCTQPITLDEIFAEYDLTQVKSYWVQATLKVSGDYNSSNCIFLLNGTEVSGATSILQTGASSNGVIVSITNSKVTYNGEAQNASFSVSGGGLNADALVLKYKTESGVEIPYVPTNVGKYKVIVSIKEGLGDFVITGSSEFDFEIETLKIAKPQASQNKTFLADGYNFATITNLPKDWAKYFDINVYDIDNNVIPQVNGSWTFFGVNQYRIQMQFKNGMNSNNGSDIDNVVWLDGTKGNYQVTLEIEQLVLVVTGWQEGIENGRATLISNNTAEIEKYFDYVIYECSGGVAIGEELTGNSTLKYETDYQISLIVKNEYKGNVVVEYNGEQVDETTPYAFKTKSNPFTDGDGSDTNGKPNGGSGNGGLDNFVEDIKNMPSYLKWVILGILILLLLLIILMIIILILKHNKKEEVPQQAIPYAQYTGQNEQQAVGDNGQTNNDIASNTKQNESFRNVRGTIVNNYKVGYKDWTFVMKETDILNLEVLESPQDEIMFYAFKKNDLRKVKKLQSQIDQAESNVNVNNTNALSQNVANDKNTNKNHKNKKN